jgi:hypothetical protein
MARSFIGSTDTGETPVVTGTIQDYQGTAFQPTTLAFTLYDKKTRTIINGRSNVNLTPIGTYVTSGGVLTLPLVAADTALVDYGHPKETFVVRLVATWSSGTQVMIQEGEMDVLGLAVPVAP